MPLQQFPTARPAAIIAAIAAVTFFAAPARGQPIFGETDSIEWMVEDSALIVRGTIDELSTEQDADGGGPWHVVTLHLQETLKGEHRPTVQFVMRTTDRPRETDLIEGWKARKEPLLVFLRKSKFLAVHGVRTSVKSRKYARYDLAPRTGNRARSFIALESENVEPVLTMALRRLSKPEEIIAAAKAAIAFPDDGPQWRGHPLPLPHDLVRGTWLDDNAGVDMTVPIDARLETQAREWIKSPVGRLRNTGAAALLYFRSEENVEALKGLFNDPYTLQNTEHDGVRVVKRERVYWVRETACGILEAWGHKVEGVVTREILPSTADCTMSARTTALACYPKYSLLAHNVFTSD